MTPTNHLQIGFNARLFPSNWRPVLDEIRFGVASGFTALQFPGKEEGLSAQHLGDEIKVVRQALDQASITAVMEILIRVDERGYSEGGHTPLEILVANLPAIAGLKCRCVHFHFVPSTDLSPQQLSMLEMLLINSLDICTGIAREWNVRFGLEHNERSIGLFASPQTFDKCFAAVPSLAFVWDINHTHPDDFDAFATFLPRASMLHVSDTRLPETNEHLPLGMGSVDFTRICQTLRAGNFQGPAILEIGGLPKSGGYNRDTDAALIDSLHRLQAANEL
jgi:sugar phosphate isomerase/epimerase